MNQCDADILRFKKTIQLTLEIAADKAKVAAIMKDDPLAILCWSYAAKEAGDWALKAATLKKIKPSESTNCDVHETAWKKMKKILCVSTAMTPNEIERLGLHLLTDTQIGDRVPELRQLQVNALERLKGKAKEVASVMIETLRDAKYQLVASDFLAQERTVFMRKQSEVMQEQEEARQIASADAGDAFVRAMEVNKSKDAALLVAEVNDSEISLSSPDFTVLQTMHEFDGSVLLSVSMIREKSEVLLSPPTIAKTLKKLIEFKFAERPQGERAGARLTRKGHKLAVNAKKNVQIDD